MNKLAIITAFLGAAKNRYMTYQEDRSLKDKLEMASRIEGIEGLELCYPADFENPQQLKEAPEAVFFWCCRDQLPLPQDWKMVAWLLYFGIQERTPGIRRRGEAGHGYRFGIRVFPHHHLPFE